MAGACGTNGVYGDMRIPVGAILKADRAGERRGHLAMDLAFGGTCANRALADQIGNKLPGHHIKEFGRGRDAKLVDLK